MNQPEFYLEYFCAHHAHHYDYFIFVCLNFISSQKHSLIHQKLKVVHLKMPLESIYNFKQQVAVTHRSLMVNVCPLKILRYTITVQESILYL